MAPGPSPSLISAVTDAVSEDVKVWQARPLDPLYPILYIVHMVRNSLNFVPWKMQKEVAADLKLIYTASTVELAEHRLGEFEKKWDKDYPSIGLSWRRNWARAIPFFRLPTRNTKSNLHDKRDRID